MRKINHLTYLNLDECINIVKEKNNEQNLTKEMLVRLMTEKNLIRKQIDHEWYFSQCDLNYFIFSLKRKDIKYLGGIGIDLSDLSLKGKVLDIGGGGEGIIGQVKSSDTIAIDPLKRELEEASSGPVKIVMNAKDLLFLDNTFDTITSFFTMMYISNIDHKKVFEEIYRVLKPNGEFILWDITIPKNESPEINIFILFLEIKLPTKNLLTGYGNRYNDKHQDSAYFIQLAESIGFRVEKEVVIEENAYVLKLIK